MTLINRVNLPAEEQNEANIKTITIGQFLDPEWQYQYHDTIASIRSLCPDLEAKLRNKVSVDNLKKMLPVGIVSGVAENGMSAQSLVALNGVAQIDIDAKDHPQIYDWQAVKAKLSQSPYFAYLGYSVTGIGCFGLIPIADPSIHEQHYEAIIEDFANTTFTIQQCNDSEPTILHGIKLDLSQKNIAAKRFVSFDPEPYNNTEAQIYEKVVEPVNIKLYEKRYTSCYDGVFDVEQFLANHNIEYTVREHGGVTQYIVHCPWEHLHTSGKSFAESVVSVNAEGKLGYHCFHDHCSDKHWREYRQYYEPDAYNQL